MTEPTKIEFHHRRISQLSDFTELIEMIFPGNQNQQHAAACIFFELKWGDSIMPSLSYLESKYGISRRVLQRARAKLSRIGLIEHVSYLNSRYGGQHGWKLSNRFETALKRMAEECMRFRARKCGSKRKDESLLAFLEARRDRPPPPTFAQSAPSVRPRQRELDLGTPTACTYGQAGSKRDWHLLPAPSRDWKYAHGDMTSSFPVALVLHDS